MVRVKISLTIDRLYDPEDEYEFRRFLMAIGCDDDDDVLFASSSMKAPMFCRIIRECGIERDDELEVKIERYNGRN